VKPFVPIQIDAEDTDGGVEDEIKRVPFFYVGDDEYTIPEEVPPAVVMSYLRDVKTGGVEYAVSQALADLIGDEAMDVLADSTKVTPEQMGQIMGIASELLMGAMQKAMGKSRSARRRSPGS
jgi:hypothetical protein